MPKEKPSASHLRALFSYDAESGDLRWRQPAGRHGNIPAGSIAGWLNGEGYRYVRVDGVQYHASHIVWVIVTGKWPRHQIDHRDTDPSNDRWDNLREATGAQNKQNCGLYRNNTSGFKGVYWIAERQCWRAKVVVDGKRKWLRRWPTAEEAYREFCEVTATEYGDFARPERKKPA